MRNKSHSIRGYTCTPYLHDHDSVELKESWAKSDNVTEVYFVTATFSSDGKLYFAQHVNHYMLAKVNDCKIASDEIKNRTGNNASFVFGVDESLFERETEGKKNFISIYYTEYIDTKTAMTEIARVISKRNRIEVASHGNIKHYCDGTPKRELPFRDNIMVFEVAGVRGQNGHQGMHKYCEQMQRDVTRRGITLTNLMGLSILDRLK